MKQIFKNLLSKMALIPKDKLLHFFYGSIIATPIVINTTTMQTLGFMIFLSIAKEILDAKMQFSKPNFIDVLFTFIPTLLLLAVKLL